MHPPIKFVFKSVTNRKVYMEKRLRERAIDGDNAGGRGC